MDTARPVLPHLLTLDELSAYIGIKKQTLYKKIGTPGCPPAIKIGGLLRFRVTEVEAWLDEQRVVKH